MKKLTSLNPEWIGLLRPKSGEGLKFDCPTCGPRHTLVAYFENPIDGGQAAAWNTRWKRGGTSFSNVTLEPSIEYPCFHGWIENGKVFDVSESPLVVSTLRGRIALSPRQAAMIAEKKALAFKMAYRIKDKYKNTE